MNLIPFTKYKLHISCTTYNHASYIENTMNGFCMQKTNFPFVAIIFDDASTDGEADVIRKFLNNNFDMSHARQEETEDAVTVETIHKENLNCHFLVVFLKYNFYSINKDKYSLIKGFYEDIPYIAICEGDDYWTDPLKLQKQVDYLEAHPRCGLVYTNAMLLIQKDGKLNKTCLPQQANFDTLLCNSPIMTLTTCYRADVFSKYINDIPWDKNWKMGDLPLWLYIASQSEIKYLPDVTSVYRVLNSSASHSNSIDKSVDFCLKSYCIRKFFAVKYNRQQFIKKICIHHINELMKLAVSHNKNLFSVAAKMAIKDYVFSPKTWIKIILYSTAFGRNYHKRKYS